MQSSPATKKSVILYVDDDRDEHFIMEVALSARPELELICFTQREELFTALEQLQHRVSAVLLDLNMPGTNGVEIASELKSHPGYAALPLAIITNGPQSPQAKQLIGSGIQVFGKPTDVAEINTLISQIISGQ